MKIIDKKKYFYIGAFVYSWLFFILMVNHDQVVSKYGILAYQPFNFLTIVMTIIFCGVLKISFDALEGKYLFWEGIKRCWMFSVPMGILILIIVSIHYHFFGGEMGLFFCY